MADFAGIEDWGLQAIVGGSDTIAMVDSQQQDCSLGMYWNTSQNNHDLLFAFSELYGQTSKLVDDGLEALFKPFYPVSDSISTQTSPVSAISNLKELKDEAEEEVQQKVETEEVTLIKQTHMDQSATIIASDDTPKYKRRKNQHKRMVIQVTAEGLSSDKWAWRKYGQKPIKGSIYPRSYYRCSSMKGCFARKQVEQSCTDPSMYIVTYTAEHCHSQPTRRNSLAGTVRHKFPTSNSDNSNMAKTKASITSSAASNEVIYTKPSLMESSEEEFPERRVKEEETVELGYNNEFSISDIMMSDDFFATLEDLN